MNTNEKGVSISATMPAANSYKRAFSSVSSEEHSDSPKRPKKNNNESFDDRPFALNKKLVRLGTQRKWKEMLRLYNKERDNDAFSYVDYATIMNQLGRMGQILNTKNPLFNMFIDDLAYQLETNGLQWMGVREVANVLHAIAKLNLTPTNQRSKHIFDLFENRNNNSSWFVNHGNTRDIANAAWACAKVGFKAHNFFSQIEQHVEWFLNEGNHQDISNTAWAFATLGIKSPKFFFKLELKAKWFVTGGNTLNISNTAWAFATLGIESYLLFNEIDQHAENLVKGRNMQHVSSTAWACATLDIRSSRFFTMIDQNARWIVNNGDAQSVALTVWAACKLKYYAPNLLAEVDRHSKRLVSTGNAQNITNTALAFATVGYDAPTFFEALEANIEKLLESGSQQLFCNTCYSLVILDLGRKHEKFLVKLWEQCLKMDHEKEVPMRGLPQLNQVEVLANVDGITLAEPSPALRERMYNAKCDDGQSGHQLEISSLLTKVGFIHETEVLPLDNRGGIFSIDMACRERKVAIEYDGQYHFLLELPTGEYSRKVDGRTKAKRRFLEKCGWRVINLDYRDRIQSQMKSGGQIQWLKRELAKLDLPN